ncbi:GDP-fucose protein O-fucosyltransferase 1-like [Acanthaster planci]|uniref:GDP-fucose protein O-fucosyltransferase 1 n=1 Tax=Acanthaster planci TaxID=133434 RepID=A0A8B7XRV7_ACAPL|nr:GDP-fucose protein O-fucosyltransferase 1-like [Acanthaster planci]
MSVDLDEILDIISLSNQMAGRITLATILMILVGVGPLVLFTCTTVGVDAETKHAYRADANIDNFETENPPNTCSGGETPCDEGDNLESDMLENSGDSIPAIDDGEFKWDPKGYVLFCPCMGRFGNQGEHYLGAMAFAKALDRTLVLPPFRTFKHASFGQLFETEPIKEFQRTILMEDFMEHLAPKYWPPGKRIGYAHLPLKSETPCEMKIGNPFDSFWNYFKVDFDDCIKYEIYNFADASDERSLQKMKEKWHARFPPEKHPVLALRGSPGSYPMLAGNRYLQKYLKWSPAFFADAGKYIRKTFKDEGFVGIHLRNGIDWERACEHADGIGRFMASPQCLEKTPGAIVTKDLCLPSLEQILNLTSQLFNKVQAKHLYIATDRKPHTDSFKKLLNPQGVSVHHLNPSQAETDLMILGQADFFIGNCISSFTSFVKRERDVNGRPSAFWSRDLEL